ncbi:hypothetical protein EJ08DRAFT_552002, partial [Tothia fuscella]
CEIEHHFGTEKPHYYALSYVWGNAKDTVPIRICTKDVDGKFLEKIVTQVTRNLIVALEHLQQDDEDVVLWIDALSINQQDEVEKGQQIMRMGDIYANA